jgi:hypothetical protein
LTHAESDDLKEDLESSRFVYQGDLFFFKREWTTESRSGEVGRFDAVKGFDGEMTRAVEQGKIANLIEGRKEDPRFFRPHNILLKKAFVTFPLSEYLEGGDALKAYRSYRSFNVTVELLGQEVLDGSRCFKVQVRTWNDGQEPEKGGRRLLWLAIDRNYLPIRTEAYASRVGGKLVEFGRVERLEEIAPGIWFPMKASIVVYDEPALRQGKSVVAGTDTFTVKRVSLDPNYGIDLFRDIKIPDGAAVYEVDDGEIVRSYRQGETNLPKPSSPRRNFWPVVGIFSFLAVLLLIVAWRYSGRKIRTKPS